MRDTDPGREPTGGDQDPAIDQPGLKRLREAVDFVARRAPSRRTIRHDAVAGLTVTVGVVPDGMANGLLAGVNPIYGLYANIIGPIVGGLLSSSRLMVIDSTSSAALVAGQAIGGVPHEDRASALFFTVMVAGVITAAFGLLRLGRLTRFVSFSVMTGFVAGIGVVLVLSQLRTVTGISAEGGNSLTQTADLVANLADLDVPSVALAVLALALAVGLARTPLRKMAGLIAIAVPTAIAAIIGLDGVALVRDVGEIGGGIPSPFIPSLGNVSVETLTGGASVAAIVLVQAAGVSQSAPNEDGSRSDASRDAIAQGAANLASGAFRGLPVGGSLSGTALGVVSGARGRWTGILSGVWMGVIVLVFPSLISRVVMPALGALLIVAAIGSIHPSEVVGVWRAGWPSQLAAATTFVSTLILPIQVAVGFGVVLSALLYLNESSTDISVVELVAHPDGRIEERPAPERLASDRVTVLDVYGRLFFAGARTLDRRLPEVPIDIEHPAVILRLRGKTSLGATTVDVLSTYADRLRGVKGRLYVTGAGDAALEHLMRTGRFERPDDVKVFEATPVLFEATRRAKADADAWLVGLHGDDADDVRSAAP